jgi:pyridoxamine 5'-phosphate oxidase
MTPGDLSSLRQSYDRGHLDERDLAPTWHDHFAQWLADALEAPPIEPNAMVLATADGAGRPSARTVLLKQWSAAGFVLFTNLESRKGRDMSQNRRASLVFPWLWMQRQVVVVGTVERLSDDESDAYFAERPYGSRLAALASPQSRVVEGRHTLEAAWRHFRAVHPPDEPVPRPPSWGGVIVVPTEVEFWQGRPDRLHDRLRFRLRKPNTWIVERLAP